MAVIASIAGRIINDSRSQPTVEVTVTTDSGKLATASVPTGGSIGKYEAHMVDAETAVHTINSVIAPALLRMQLKDQQEIDDKLQTFDLSLTKEKLGVNSTLPISLACARLLAQFENVPLYHYIYTLSKSSGYSLPTPMFNLINGGKHAKNNLDFQEYMIVPLGLGTFWEKVSAGKKIFAELGKILSSKGLGVTMGDEGGYAPNLTTNEEGMGILVDAIKQAGYTPGQDVYLGLDIAASGLATTYAASVPSYLSLFQNFPLLSLEDPFKEDEWANWTELRHELDKITNPEHPHLLVGDDLFVGSSKKLKEGIEKVVANAILIKMNHAATLTEILESIALARKYNYVHIISHRSGETLDTFMSDLAIGTAAAFVKAGAPNDQAPHRIVKYERIMQVEEELAVVRR